MKFTKRELYYLHMAMRREKALMIKTNQLVSVEFNQLLKKFRLKTI